MFLTSLALAIAALVALPYWAHRLRRQRADERPFPPASYVPASPPRARRRARLEQRALFAVRALGVVLLAVLGASPLVRCSRVSVSRGGASIALAFVIDDSLSMRAPSGGKTRFARARSAAVDIVATLRDGDAVAVVLAGKPPRVALAATTDLSVARSTVDGLREADRATSLDEAVAMASALIADLPQIDKRVVVLSDLADGPAEGAPLAKSARLPLWFPLPELRGALRDCAVVEATRRAERVEARVACSEGAPAEGRVVELRAGASVVDQKPLTAGVDVDIDLRVPTGVEGPLVVSLTGRDDLDVDDRAPVLFERGASALCVVEERADTTASTGGAPIVEQALGALRAGMVVRPLPVLPDRAEDLAPFAGVVVDDPPGLTPEQRHALAGFARAGGVVLLTLGPRAASSPLGASFEPLLAHAVRWESTLAKGARADGAEPAWAESVDSMLHLEAPKRARIDAEDEGRMHARLAWEDGALLVGTRELDAGRVWVMTLPLSLDASDLVLRPGFLAILDSVVEDARSRQLSPRADVGVGWRFPPGREVTLDARAAAGGLSRTAGSASGELVADRIGRHVAVIDGKEAELVARPPVGELAAHTRALGEGEGQVQVGSSSAPVDVSWVVALALLALFAVELVVRLAQGLAQRREEGVDEATA